MDDRIINDILLKDRINGRNTLIMMECYQINSMIQNNDQ